MSKTDPDRVRRLIAGLKMPREQPCGWALLALGLADRDKSSARSALAESILLIDGLGGPRDLAERVNLRLMVADNPAASILPIVEKVTPERLNEVFWKAVALMPKVNKDPQSVVRVSAPSITRPSWPGTTARWPTCCSRRPRHPAHSAPAGTSDTS